MEPENYLPLVETLERVPVNPPDFAISQNQGREFGFSSRDLAALACAGLPHLQANGSYMFRWSDLHYLGLRLGTAKPYLLNIRLWAKTFTQLSKSRQTDIEVDYSPKLKASTPDGVVGTLVLPGGVRRSLPLRSGEVAATLKACQFGLWPNPPPRLAAIFDGFADLQLYVIPQSLRGSARKIMQLGLSDCENAAHLAVDACTREGFEARAAYGLLISFPFSIPHSWAEVFVGGRWMSFDPLTATAMNEFAGNDVPSLMGSHCLSAILLRVADEPVPLVSIDGVPVDASFTTRSLAESG